VLTDVLGVVPLEIGQLTELIRIDFFQSDLRNGPIPDSIGLCTKLVKVRFQNCKLVGQFPPELQISRYLYHFNEIGYLTLSVNVFSGSIPIWICELVGLMELELQINNFKGLIPQCIGSLKLLKTLDLGDTFLTGELPIGICDLSSLESLGIFDTNIVGMLLFSNAMALYPHA
jgi:Leucine-rich repeat (LRR) protein